MRVDGPTGNDPLDRSGIGLRLGERHARCQNGARQKDVKSACHVFPLPGSSVVRDEPRATTDFVRCVVKLVRNDMVKNAAGRYPRGRRVL